MAKEIYIDGNGNEQLVIYIDGNGNEQLVSGTINNAELLPIESGSATNTKSYIDSGLSGKADSFTSGSFTANANVSILNGFYNKTGDMVFWSCCFSVSANLNTGTKILSGLPHKNEQDNLPCFLREISASDTSASCRIYRGDLYPNVALTSGKTYHAMGIYTID